MRRVALALIVPGLLWLGGLAWFVQDLDTVNPDPEAVTDAIVVLTGGSQRIAAGLALLSEGKAAKLFISGVHPGIEAAEMLRLSHAAPQLFECCVVLGHTAGNTLGNAVETARWLDHEGYRSLRVVTANYHMRRAMLEFRRVLAPGIALVAHPVVPEGARPAGPWSWRGTQRVIVVEYVKYLGALARSLLVPSVPVRP
jgi:uncharacterized SAM-binding protein YcdF (DUF218 family)